MQRPNSSHSRTYLRKDNYLKPRLLKTIRGQPSSTTSSLGRTKVYSKIDSTPEPPVQSEMHNDNDDDLAIYGQPVSSDEDDSNQTKPSPRSKLNQKSNKSPISSPKRAPTTAASSRSKRRKLQDGPDLGNFVVPDNVPAVPLFPESWNSSGSQKKRLTKTYAQRKGYQIPDPVIENRESSEKTPTFVVHKQIERTAKRPTSIKTFVGAPPLPGVKNGRQSQSPKQELAIAELPQGIMPRKEPGFRMPDLPDLPDFVSSATTSATDIPSIFEAPMSPGDDSHTESESSTLSSARSLASSDYKIDLPSVNHRCPACRKFVTPTAEFPISTQLRKLPLQKQQEFCLDHQLAEAKDLWEKNGYPDIQWDDLENVRIPEKLPSLKKIISRQQSSYYLDDLDHRIQEAKGNRRKIQTYLTQGIVDVAKPGYYGLKGSRSMVNAITESLTDALVEALQTDSTIRHAGVGAYVSAVLVPELTLLLVMEDMHVDDPVEGRRILDQSSPVGVLLNPDDDHIERHEDETEL